MKQSTELKINQKAQRDGKVRDLLKAKRTEERGTLLQKRRFYDAELEVRGSARDKKKASAFHFVEEGLYVRRGEQLRKRQALEELEKREEAVLEAPEETPLADAKPDDGRISLRKTLNLRPLDAIPEWEWWDLAVLAEGKADVLFLEKITHFVQHPVPLTNDYVEGANKMVVPVHLTPKEKKRLRKMKRLEREKDKLDKIKFGIAAPPLPRITMRNYMQVLGKEAVADPSRVEQQVKAIVERRQEEHLRRNEANKLTGAQKEAKMKRKHERDVQNNECRAALFKVDRLGEPHLRFKVDMNAQQYHLGGYCFVADLSLAPAGTPSLVLVEGGARAIKKYKRLMLRRIRWSATAKQRGAEDAEPGGDESADEARASLDRKCHLVWEGVVRKRTFEKWRVVDIRSEGEAKRLLAEKGCEHYWSMVANFRPERAQGEEPDDISKVLE